MHGSLWPPAFYLQPLHLYITLSTAVAVPLCPVVEVAVSVTVNLCAVVGLAVSFRSTALTVSCTLADDAGRDTTTIPAGDVTVQLYL